MINFESEKCFEDFITQQHESEGICIIDECEYEKCYRQFDTKTYGIPDLVFVGSYMDLSKDNEPIEVHRIHVVELKNEQIKTSNLAQISRYKTYFDRAFSGHNVELSFSLVVPKGVIDCDDACWLINSLEGIDVYEFYLDPSEGIKFKLTCGWSRISEDFSPAIDLIEKSNEEEI